MNGMIERHLLVEALIDPDLAEQARLGFRRIAWLRQSRRILGGGRDPAEGQRARAMRICRTALLNLCELPARTASRPCHPSVPTLVRVVRRCRCRRGRALCRRGRCALGHRPPRDDSPSPARASRGCRRDGLWPHRQAVLEDQLLGVLDRDVRDAAGLVDPAVALQLLLSLVRNSCRRIGSFVSSFGSGAPPKNGDSVVDFGIVAAGSAAATAADRAPRPGSRGSRRGSPSTPP